jgi:hypothetical protein
MIKLVIGITLLVASVLGLWFSRAVDGNTRAFVRNGRDVWIAISITVGVGLGISSFVAGVAALANP